jgi:hypothetical protein
MHLTNDILRVIAANSVGVSGLLLMSPGLSAPELLASAVLLLAVLIATVWLVRARAARRWTAVVNAYADREIARARKDTRRKRDRHLVYVRNRWPIRPEPSFGPSPL